MRSKHIVIAGLVFLLAIPAAKAQLDSLKASIGSTVAFGSAGYLPFHVGYNEFGKLNPNYNDGFIEGSLYYPILNKGKWKIETGANYIVKPVLDQSFFHQLFVNVHFGPISLRVGSNQVENGWYDDELGTGHMFLSQNARTIPKLEIGIMEYTELPFFKYIAIKGGASIARLSEDRVINEPLYHEKFAYIKTANLPVNVYAGLNHNVLFGGTRPDGTELPSDFQKVFFAQSAPGSGNASDSINAAGAHFGVFDLGFELPFEGALLKGFFQQPISDGSGFSTNFTANKDYILGLMLEFDDHPFLRKIMYENFYTIHQSGEGTFDPIINGRFFTLGQLEQLDNYEEFVLREFGLETENLSWPEFREIIKNEANSGYLFGGRDDYYNNGQYPNGNTYHELVIGNPLFTTRNRFERTTGEELNERLFIINNRIVAHHVGIGAYYKDVDINFFVTWSSNYGTYAGKYSGNRGGWNLDEDYYFLNAVGLQYFGLELKKSLNKLDYRVMLGVDNGDFGNNVGGLLGVTYNFR